MKDLISKLIFKIQTLAMTKLYELYLWIIVCGAISSIGLTYISQQYSTNLYSAILITLFVYYSGYKLILE